MNKAITLAARLPAATLTLLLIALTAPPLDAITLHWGSAAGDFIYESDGTTQASPGDFNFELGTFADGFTPSDTNMADWANNWHLLDLGSYSNVTGRFAGTVSLFSDPAPSIVDGNASDPATFFFGKNAYIWIYNQNTTIDNTLEWALLNNPNGDGSDPATAWTFPTAVEAGAHSAVEEFALSDPGVMASYGEELGGGTTTTGDGSFTTTPTEVYGIQTFTVPNPVPEPSSSLLTFAGALLLFARRRRS